MGKDSVEQERELWEQQPGESSAAFAHFVFYRDMRYPKVSREIDGGADGNITVMKSVVDGSIPYVKRSIRKTAEAVGINTRTIANQSRAHKWVARCEAYDAYIDRRTREANEAALVKMNSEHALLAQQMIRKATKRLLSIDEALINTTDLVRMFEVGVKIERLARGESTENSKVTHSGDIEIRQNTPLDLSGLTDEELEQFEQLFQKIAGGASDG